MARYESKGGRGPKRGSSNRNPHRNRRDFDDDSRSRDSGRGFSRDRRDVQMTEVTCSSCGERCEVPFKPTSSKPVYCDNCFGKNKKGPSNHSDRDLDIINEKLNKIMKALKIE
tara:strand:+ start:56 stop:394 length:339 start_codon:yes stop_codon:yes gene_type:complete